MKKTILFFLLGAVSSACSPVVSMHYTPINRLEINVAIAVTDFIYQPIDGIDSTQIRKQTLSDVYFTMPVAKYVENAVNVEVNNRHKKTSILEPKCKLSGTIYDMAMEDMKGFMKFDADYITEINYVLKNIENENLKFSRLIRAVYVDSRYIPDVEMLNTRINKSLSKNINQLITDPLFLPFIEENC